jgi:hypothetical protein
MQSNKMSVVETSLNIGSGVIIAWAMAFWLLPLWGHSYTIAESFNITLIFTSVSWFRSYMWRRFFSGRA